MAETKGNGRAQRARAWLGGFPDHYPRLNLLMEGITVAVLPAASVLGVVYGQEIRTVQLWYLLPYLALSGLGLALLILQLLGRRFRSQVPSIHLRAVEGVLGDLQLAIMCRPMVGTELTAQVWREYFDNLARLAERAINGVLQLREDEGVACNLMVALPVEAERFLKQLVHALEQDKEPKFCFEPEEEGIHSPRDNHRILMMCGRGPTARKRDYPWLCLRVPREAKRALPGAPVAFHNVKSARNGVLPHSYVPHPTNLPDASWGDGVDRTARNAFNGYFTQFRDHVGSFVSIGLQWDGEPIGVLNIDCRDPAFLDDPHSMKLAIALLGPYTEIANALARGYVLCYEGWLKNG